MTEREKMLAGQLYDCGDEELITRWHVAKDLVRNYNQVDSENLQEKEFLTSCWAEEERTSGSRRRFMWITGIISILAIIARSI